MLLLVFIYKKCVSKHNTAHVVSWFKYRFEIDSERFRAIQSHSGTCNPNVFRIRSETDSGMARNSSDSLGMTFNPIISPGY